MGLGVVDSFIGGVIVTAALTGLWLLILTKIPNAALRFVLANVLSLITAMVAWTIIGPINFPGFRGSFSSAALQWALFPQFCVFVAGLMRGMIAVSKVAMAEARQAPPPPAAAPVATNPFLAPPKPAEPVAPRIYRFNNIIARHWRGELQLWTAFWAFGVFLTVAVNGVLIVIFTTLPLQMTFQPQVLFAAVAGIWVFTLGLTLWQWVGVWRSASRYSAERRSRGLRAAWGVATKVAVALVGLQTFGLIATQAVPQMTEFTKMAFLGDPDMPPFAMRVMRDGHELEITGGFKYGMNLALTDLLERWPDVEVIHFTSNGGRIGEAREVFATIRAYRLSTYVPNTCASACTYAFAAGRERWAGPGAEFGFHSPALPGFNDADIEFARQDILDLLAGSGIDEAFIRRGLRVDPLDMWFPPTETLRAARYITGEAEPDQFAASGWGFQEGFGAEMTAADFAEISTWRYSWLEDLEEFRPEAFLRVGAEGLEAYLAGQTSTETRRSMGMAANRAAHDIQYLAASDTIRDIAVRLLYEYRYLRDRNPSECYAYAVGGPGGTSEDLFSGATLQDHFSYARAIVETARDRPRDPAAPRYQAALDARLATVLDERERALLDATEIAPSDHARYCDAVIAYFDTLLGMPYDDSVALLRAVLETRWRLR